MPHRVSFRYQAFGLSLQSALALPELRENPDAATPADVTVSIGPAPCPDEGVVPVADGVRAGPDIFWMDVAGTARLLVRHGREIVIDAYPAASESDIRAYLLGSAIGALLHQRGLLALHASAVEIDGRAVAFMAPSGGGKSTIAMHLHQLGHRVIADDICALHIGGTVRLWPGLRNLKLWRASLSAMQETPDGLEPVFTTLDKYRFPITALADYQSYDLAAVVLLAWGDTPTLVSLPGAAGVGALIANTFRGQLVAPMGREAAHWQQCLATFRAAGVHVLTRPRVLEQLDAGSALIVSNLGHR